MPNRDHDDTPYNRSEGRFESQRDEYRSPYQREQSYRPSRDWERRDDSQGERYRSSGESYNPARDECAYRGGSRYELRTEERNRYGRPSETTRGYEPARAYEPPRSYEPTRSYEEPRGYDQTRGYDTRAWDDDARWREGLRDGSPAGYAQGSFGRDASQRESFGHSGARGAYGGQSGYDWNRQYTRDWDRDYRGDWERHDARQQQEHGDLGEQLRHGARQVIGKVKRAFRGPRGYKRSDERIREDVNDRLAQQDEFDPSDVEVRVENGDVTLTGSVRNRHEKFRAEEIADDVSGVSEVHNQLRIGSVQTQQTVSTSTTASTSTPTARNGRA
jgi:osmotically-inducible protein OsmY